MIRVAGDFTASLWKEVKPIYKKMLNHPFSKGLQKASLDKKAFNHYLSQDILYLKDDAKAMKNVAKKEKNPTYKEFFLKMQDDMIVLEKMLEKRLLKKFKTKKAKQKSKVIKKYTSFLVQTSKHEDIFYAYSALLPCFWLYSAVGIKIYKKSKKSNPYRDWIEFYNGKEIITYTNLFIKIVENYASNLTKKQRKKMKQYFLKSSKYELAFFNEAIKIGENHGTNHI